jgi:hypothetical protein
MRESVTGKEVSTQTKEFAVLVAVTNQRLVKTQKTETFK